MCSLKGVVRLEGCHNLWPHLHFAIILILTSVAASVVVLFCRLLFWDVKGRVSEYVLHEPCPSEGIGEGQMALWRVIVELPYELVREGPVVVLQHFAVQLLHPADLDEQAGVVARRLLPNPALHAVPELAIAVLHPECVDGVEVLHGDELDLREENIPSTTRRLARKVDEERTGGLVGLAEVSLRELLAQELQGGSSGRGCRGGRADRSRSRGGCCGRHRGGAAGEELEGNAGAGVGAVPESCGRGAFMDCAAEERMVVLEKEGLERSVCHGWRQTGG